MAEEYSVALTDVVKRFHLEVLFAATDYESIRLTVADVARPGLQLAGVPLHFRQRNRQGPRAHHSHPHPRQRVHGRLPALHPVGGAARCGKGKALDPETRLEAGAGRGACLDRSRVCAARKNEPVLHSGGCLGRPGAFVAALARGREMITWRPSMTRAMQAA